MLEQIARRQGPSKYFGSCLYHPSSNPLTALYNDFVHVKVFYIFQLCKYVWKIDISFALHICAIYGNWCYVKFQFSVEWSEMLLLACWSPWMMGIRSERDVQFTQEQIEHFSRARSEHESNTHNSLLGMYFAPLGFLNPNKDGNTHSEKNFQL